MGTEAGESLADIVARKETERLACDGVFYWGIGSAIGPAISALLSETDTPQVLFSPIKSPPRAVDASPSHIVRWSGGHGLLGEYVALPQAAQVTSRWNPARPQTARYALVCASDAPLGLTNEGEIYVRRLRNLRSGAPIGASQVTAVVRCAPREARPGPGARYQVALRASLVWPYLIRLARPTPAPHLAAATSRFGVAA